MAQLRRLRPSGSKTFAAPWGCGGGINSSSVSISCGLRVRHGKVRGRGVKEGRERRDVYHTRVLLRELEEAANPHGRRLLYTVPPANALASKPSAKPTPL